MLAAAYGLLNDIWGQGHGKRERFLHTCGGQNGEETFWEMFVYPLLQQQDSNNPLQVPDLNGYGASNNGNDDGLSKYCYRMEVCSFALRITASQLIVSNATSTFNRQEERLLNCMASNKLLDQWFQSFCCFTSPSSVLVRASKSTLEMGINLMLFEQHLPVPPPGCRTYGVQYIYDTKLLHGVLEQRDGDSNYNDQVNRCIDKLKNSNKMLGVADAQLFALQSLKQFMEVYCLRIGRNPTTTGGDGSNGGNGGKSTAHLLNKQTIQLFHELSKNRSVTPIVNQELTQLLLIVLHKKIFPSSLPMNVAGVGIGNRFTNGSELTEWSSELQTQAPASGLTMDHCASLMEIMTEWCTKIFGHQLNAKNIGFSGGAGTAQSNSTGTSNNTQLLDRTTVESVKPLLACCVLVFHTFGELKQ